MPECKDVENGGLEGEPGTDLGICMIFLLQVVRFFRGQGGVCMKECLKIEGLG